MAIVRKTLTSYPTDYSTSGSINGTHYKNAIGNGSDTSSASGNDYSNGGSSSTAIIDYSFEFEEIPSGATIESVECTVKGHCENRSRSTATLQLYAGSVAKGSSSKFTSTSAQTVTLTTGTWTADEIPEMKLRFTIGYYGGLVNGATVTVVYSYDDVKWVITVNGEGATPQGETEVSNHESFTVKIAADEAPKVVDNNVDVSAQVVQHVDSDPTYAVEQADGTNYGFSLNSDGYYESNNQGRANSTALSIVRLSLPVSCNIVFTLINYAESTYDFGLLGDVDDTLSTSHSEDSSYYWSGRDENSRYEQTVTYSRVAAGEHEIYVKYFKDTYTDDNNDSLQFKVSIEALEPVDKTPYFVYTIGDVTEAHTIVVSAFGPDLYIKENGVWTPVIKVYKKINGAWVEQDDWASLFNTSYVYVHSS